MTLSTTADGRVRCRAMDASPLCLSARRPSERLAWRPGQWPIVWTTTMIHHFLFRQAGEELLAQPQMYEDAIVQADLFTNSP